MGYLSRRAQSQESEAEEGVSWVPTRRSREGGACGADLHGVGALIKPALLYADRVTIYSPAATLITAVTDLKSIKEQRDRALAAITLVQAVPSLASNLNADSDTLDALRTFVSVDPRLMKAAAKAAGAEQSDIDEMYEQLDKLSDIWDSDFPDAADKAVAAIGAEELLSAVKAQAIEVADFSAQTSTSLVADSVNAALGTSDDAITSAVIGGFTERVVEMLTENQTFPLLDASSSDLVNALLNEHRLQPSAASIRRGVEVSATAGLMGFLPNFVDLPIDEVLDLRRKLNTPLIRFRGEMGRLATEFEARSFDPGFAAEVDDAWRTRVEPALVDIREALAQHGLLREVASVALGDPSRLIAEAGGVFAAAHTDLLSLSGLMTLTTAMAVPAADVAGRAVQGVLASRRNVRRSAFYYLHKIEREAP